MRLATFLLALLSFVFLTTALPVLPAAARAGYAEREDVRAFIAEMVAKHGFRTEELTEVFLRARTLPAALDAIRPREAVRSWERYRANFLNDRRLDAGVEFVRTNRALLARARMEYGVPEEIIAAIIGVETFYGRNMGRWRVIDALSTLSFDYPERAVYFRGELENYLIYARDADLNVFSVLGSYAGAIGMPQFMPGSYLRFAVDYDGDGSIDLRASTADTIGSVANFLAKHGWKSGTPVMSKAALEGDAYRGLIDGTVLPKIRMDALRAAGVRASNSAPAIPDDMLGVLIELDTPGRASEFRIGFQNFWVLTRYNRSALYASAVADFAAALRERAPF